ncbi:MAG TPA: oxidoreductase [Actinomycetes bacterium]|nr:oxidoreductase [Actinomycetes bacterium]
MAQRRPRLAVWKLASCDGCQLTLLSCEDELLALAGEMEIAYFLEASSDVGPGPYDLSLVEGSVSTPDDLARVQEIRRISGRLVTIGACATAGGIQALRDFADVREFTSVVYAHPEYVRTLERSTGVAEHVPVDFELRGCPIDRGQLLEVLTAYLHDRRPRIPAYSVCVECKRRGVTCVTVAHGTPCLGPVTHAGCGALCPAYGRGCYGCFGPQENPSTGSLSRRLVDLGMPERDVARVYRTFNAGAEAFREESRKHEEVP